LIRQFEIREIAISNEDIVSKSFDISNFRGDDQPKDQYRQQLRRLHDVGNSTECIEQAVAGALQNLTTSGQKSFVIYGEPQSGKTEMMICLTAKLLDDGHRFIVHLLNDSVDLLGQNLSRFHNSGLAPAAQNFMEIADPAIDVKVGPFVVFCKKNGSNLRDLISKIGKMPGVIVIDDEADYATPNSKINKNEKTPINELIGKIIGKTGHYIGVTATPARLNLNNTFDNDSKIWVKFPTHRLYTGQDHFFPMNIEEIGISKLQYRLELMSDKHDDFRHERNALFRFMVNAAHLNLSAHDSRNFAMLIHTSGRKIDHKTDLESFRKIFSVLDDKNHRKFEKYAEEIWNAANAAHPGMSADSLTRYVLTNARRRAMIVLNSEPDFKKYGGNATNPSALFTLVIGGNIVSRGVTFNNLLSMFFTRDVKNKLQQDTYIQRARMFGSRGAYLRHFELTIPMALYADWHRCFVYHRLALASIESGLGSPVWIADHRISAVAGGSIDHSTVDLDRGEMSFAMFNFDDRLDEIAQSKSSAGDKVNQLANKLGDSAFPKYLREFILRQLSTGKQGLKVFSSASVFPNMLAEEKAQIQRRQGFLTIREGDRAGNTSHFLRIFKNDEGKARLFYKFDGSIQFIKNLKK
jgi:Z1 domain